MKSTLHKKIRQAALRCHADLLLRQAGTMLAWAGAAGLLGLALQRVLGLAVLQPWMLAGLVGLAMAAALAGYWYLRPCRLEVAVLIDQRLGLRERISTALSLAESEDPFARAACAEARQFVNDLDVRPAFPVRPTRCWAWSASAWAAVAAAFFFLPEVDLLGYLGRSRTQQEANRTLQQARQDVQQAQQKLAPIVKQLNNPELSAELAKLAQAAELTKAQDVQRQAVRKLGELADKVKDLQNTPKMQAFQELRELLRGLKGPSEGLKPEINRDIAKGDYAKAGQALRELQKQIEENKLSPEAQAALAAQLKDLSQQLSKLAQDKQGLKEAMENAGVNPETAGLGGEELKKALEKQGLSQEKIEQLLRQAEASQKASELARKLAEELGQCSGEGKSLRVVELGDVADQLEVLEGQGDELASAETTLEDIQELIDRLGRGEKLQLMKGKKPGDGNLALALPGQAGEGEAGQGTGAFSPDGDGKGKGTGQRGIGQGERKVGSPEETSLEKTRAPSANKPSKSVASWYFRGPQITGESKLELKEVIQAGKDQAAEAINENQIPRKYEGAVKKYFGELEEAATQPAK